VLGWRFRAWTVAQDGRIASNSMAPIVLEDFARCKMFGVRLLNDQVLFVDGVASKVVDPNRRSRGVLVPCRGDSTSQIVTGY
jgi:hypothetical protein